MPEPAANVVLLTLIFIGVMGCLYLFAVGISEWLGPDIANIFHHVYDRLESCDDASRRNYGGMLFLAVGSWLAGYFDGKPRPSLVVVLIVIILSIIGWFLLTSDKGKENKQNGKDEKGQ